MIFPGEDADGTVRFSLGGADYEIDLTADHAAELRGMLAKYAAHGRRLRGAPGSRDARTAPTGRDETQRIRDWAKAHGYNRSARGRISQDIKKAYNAAQAQRDDPLRRQ
jgi:hypothetical protein